jgi:lipase chaperone LimK
MKKTILSAAVLTVISISTWQIVWKDKNNHSPITERMNKVFQGNPTPITENTSTSETSRASAIAIYQRFEKSKPLYLQDTEVPATFSVTASGDLIINSDVKDILDYFLLMRGDVSDQDIYTIMLGYIDKTLQDPARTQATEVLQRYTQYLDHYVQWQQASVPGDVTQSDPAELKNRLLELHELRAHLLGDEIFAAFFAEEEQVNMAYAEAKIALNDANATATTRDAIVASLNAALPDAIREANQHAMRQVALTESLQALKARGASPQEIEQKRIEWVGVEANSRLKQVDQARLAWAAKRQEYKALMAQRLELQDMSMEALANIGEIQSLGLSETDLRRMQALDRIEKRVQ